MKIILRENVPNVGKIGDILTVADGFGRNYLLPRNLATLANERNVGQMEHHKRVATARLSKAKAAARVTADRMSGLRVVATRHAGEDGKLFGSVTNADVADRLNERGMDFEVDRKWIHLEEPIKTLGEFKVPVRLTADVTAEVEVRVERAE